MLTMFRRKKKGQLFVIEAFIAVSVMIILVTALYNVQLASPVTKEPKYADEIYTVMKTLDKNGVLESYLVSIKDSNSVAITQYKEVISESIYSVLPSNGEFYLYCENITNSNKVVAESIINPIAQMPEEAVSIYYLISAIKGNFEPYAFHVSVWLKGV